MSAGFCLSYVTIHLILHKTLQLSHMKCHTTYNVTYKVFLIGLSHLYCRELLSQNFLLQLIANWLGPFPLSFANIFRLSTISCYATQISSSCGGLGALGHQQVAFSHRLGVFGHQQVAFSHLMGPFGPHVWWKTMLVKIQDGHHISKRAASNISVCN